MLESKTQQYSQVASILKEAEISNKAIIKIPERYEGISISDAYKIQRINIDKELDSGKKITGKKIGLTSVAMQKLLGVDQADFGHLLNSMEVKNGVIDRSKLIQPKVEAELAFILKEELIGPNITAEQVLAATDYVVPSIEIVDSRIENWKISITDTIADNASSGMYYLSNIRIDPRTTDLASITMRLKKNGIYENEGRGEDVLGNPAEAVAWLANVLSEYGSELKKGEVVLSGAFSAALTAEKDDIFTAEFENIGDVSIRFI